MSVVVFAENVDGNFKKTTYEVVTYGKKVAQKFGGNCLALVFGEVQDINSLATYGADKIINISGSEVKSFTGQVYAHAIKSIVLENDAHTVVMSHSSRGKAVLGRLSVGLQAGCVSGVNALPERENGFTITKTVFSGKAIAKVNINTEIRILSLMGNSIPPEEIGGIGEVIKMPYDGPVSKVKVLERKTIDGTVPLPEAELVVSAGRGMKAPENWGIIEELAEELQATTACSRPVADTGWRPHHEHVGQTGVAIRPNLYIAVGISGAIQHLAGVNNSKVIVVVNKDPEAPFFKAADYGVVGDLFEVIPRLTKALRKFKATG